jgi:HSP20 family molecular chaperone IbpA
MMRHDENHRLPSLRAEVETLFNEVLSLGRTPGSPSARWLPSLDLIEESGSYVIEIDMPGVRLEDLVITVTGRKLTLRGRRQMVRELAGSRIRLQERWFGEFSRSLDLPGPVDAGRMTATLREGILRIELPWGGRRP